MIALIILQGFSALHYAAVTNTSGAQIQVLLAAGLPIDTSLHNPGGHTALHSAAESKCLKTAATLISAGISPYTKNSNGETPGFYYTTINTPLLLLPPDN